MLYYTFKRGHEPQKVEKYWSKRSHFNFFSIVNQKSCKTTAVARSVPLFHFGKRTCKTKVKTKKILLIDIFLKNKLCFALLASILMMTKTLQNIKSFYLHLLN